MFKKKEYFASEVKLIVGLGNVGKQYSNTRHNCGFMVIKKILKELQIPESKLLHKFIGDFWKGKLDNSYNVIFAMPATYMNNSWQFIKDIMNYYGIQKDNLLVIYDEKDLDLGQIRLKKSKPTTSHNGIKGIIKNFDIENLNRIQVGIKSEKMKNIPTDKFVLGGFSQDELLMLNPAIAKAASAVFDYIHFSFEEVMQKYNTKQNDAK